MCEVITYQGHPAIRICRRADLETTGCLVIVNAVPEFLVAGPDRHFFPYEWDRDNAFHRILTPLYGRTDKCLRHRCEAPMGPRDPGIYCERCSAEYAIERAVGPYCLRSLTPSLLSQVSDHWLQEWVLHNGLSGERGSSGPGTLSIDIHGRKLTWAWEQFEEPLVDGIASGDDFRAHYAQIVRHRLTAAAIVPLLREMVEESMPWARFMPDEDGDEGQPAPRVRRAPEQPLQVAMQL